LRCFVAYCDDDDDKNYDNDDGDNNKNKNNTINSNNALTEKTQQDATVFQNFIIPYFK
jgi:hypothetical protein